MKRITFAMWTRPKKRWISDPDKRRRWKEINRETGRTRYWWPNKLNNNCFDSYYKTIYKNSRWYG